MKQLLLFLSILSINITCAQKLTSSTSSINFGDTYEITPNTISLTISNPESFDIDIKNIRFYSIYKDTAFSSNISTGTVTAGGNLQIDVTFAPKHNVPYNTEMVIATSNGGSLSIDLQGQGKYSKTYYAASENKSEQDLKQTLKTIISANYITLGYSPARDEMFMDIDNMMVNGQGATQNRLETAYTGSIISGYTSRTDAQNQGVNTEHTFPQSYFNSSEPMRSDIHHLFICDANANSERSNLPFGNVNTPPTWSVGGSKKGIGIFEPRDEQKGTTARAMMYFVIRYQDYSGFYFAQKDVMREWNENFLPDAVEQKRNDDTEDVQQNRNPFIDYPQFADRITSFATNSVEASNPQIDTIEGYINYGFIPAGPNEYNYVIHNNGNEPVTFSNFSTSTDLTITNPSSSSTLQPGESLNLKAEINLSNTSPYSGFIIFNTDISGVPGFYVPVYANSTNIGVKEYDFVNFSLSPNPAKKQVNIELETQNNTLFIYNIIGELVLSKDVFKGSNNISLSTLSKGSYFVKIGNRTEKLIIE